MDEFRFGVNNATADNQSDFTGTLEDEDANPGAAILTHGPRLIFRDR
jgi:hypothetical protein